MNTEKFEKYLTDRYLDQINWYSDRAGRNKSLYQLFQWGVIILSASVPVLLTSIPETHQWITICVSVVLAIGTTALKTFKFQENWINYRSVAETLKKEKFFFDANLHEYSVSEDKMSLFVKRIESLISRENTLWVTAHQQKEETHRDS